MATLPLMSANSYWGLAPETTFGASVAVTTMTPVNSPKVSPAPVWLADKDFRGSPVDQYDAVAGVAKSSFSAKTYTYTDVYPHLLRAALGSTDTVASVAPSTWTHVIGLNFAPNTGSNSPSYSLWNDSVDATYLMLGSRLNTLSVSFTADAAVENTFEFMTQLPTQLPTSASVSASPSSVQHLIPAWNCGASIGGSAVTVVESFTLDIKRNTTQIFTLGSQSAVSNFQGPIAVSGKLSVIVQQGESYWANALVYDQQQILLQLTDPVTGYYILYQMSKCQLMSPVINIGKSYVSLDMDFTAMANTTDAIVPNTYSPITTTTRNGVSTAY